MVPPKRQDDEGAPEVTVKKQKQNPQGSKILASLDEAGLGLRKGRQVLDDEDKTKETTAAGRPKGAKNYSLDELELLVSCVKEFIPITSQDFGAVADLYNRLGHEKEYSPRTPGPLRQRFEKLQKFAPKLDGNDLKGEELHEAAKAITLIVETKAGMKTVVDNPATRALRVEEAYLKITQENDDLDHAETPVSDVRTKLTAKKSKGSVIDLTAGSSDDESAKTVIKQEVPEDVGVPREKKAKGKGVVKPVKSGGGNIVTKTYRQGDGKVTGKVAATETVLGAIATHLSAESQEQRDLSQINLLRESRFQDRQDRVLEEREKEINDLKQENISLRERATSAETMLNLAYGYGSFAYQPGPTPGPSVYRPPTHAPAMPPFAPNPDQYTITPTVDDNSRPAGIPGLEPMIAEDGQQGADASGSHNSK